MTENRKLKNEELGRADLEEFKRQSKTPVVVVLDNIRSLNNIGSVFRTADAFAIESIHLCGITAQPPHREINKTALGATESVEWQYFKNTEASISQLKSEGYQIYSVEQAENSILLNAFQIAKNEKIAVVFGHEVKGVGQNIINQSNGVIEIPQKGTKHSLNISVSVGVILWELSNQLNK